jgi:hypothetical protein
MPTSSAIRSRLLLAAAIATVVAGVVLYVVRSTDEPVNVGISGGAPGAFNRNNAIEPGIRRGIFSPDGSRLATISAAGVGIAEKGHVQPVTPAELGAVDAAWMPDAKSLLVAEGPATLERLAVYQLDGTVTGVAKLDAPFSVGEGYGLTVDSRGARAVAAAETRDAVGGRRHLDLVLVDLPTGQVHKLTQTLDVDEAWPLFVDDTHVLLAATDAKGTRVVELDLASGEQHSLSPADESARPVGVLRGGMPVYASAANGKGVSVWAVRGTSRVRMGGVPAGSTVWAVDPTGSRAVATVITTTEDGQHLAVLRAVTLNPPTSG